MQRTTIRLFALSLATLTAACNSTMPQQAAMVDPADACFRAQPANPRWSVLAQHMPIGDPRTADTRMLSNTAKPSEEEKTALSEWANARQLCTQMGVEFRRQHAPPGVASIFERQQLGILQAIAKLYAGEISYGQFISERINLALQATSSLDNLRAQHVQESMAANTQALQSLQMMQLLQNTRAQPAQAPALAPTVNCTSQRIGVQVQTTCR